MNLKDLEALMTQDSFIDQSSLLSESLNTIPMINKWLGICDQERLVLEAIEAKQAALERELHDYYSGRSADDVYEQKPFNFTLAKTEIPKYINGDPRWIELKKLCTTQEIKIRRIDAFTKVLISTRSPTIRQAIDMLKFNNGVV